MTGTENPFAQPIFTTYAPGHYTKMFQRQCFLTAYLALLSIFGILLLMSRSLIKMKIHASYSLLFTQHSLSFIAQVGGGGTNVLQLKKLRSHGSL